MYYIHTASGQRYSLDEVRLRHPQVSIPDGADLLFLGYTSTPAPAVVPVEVTRVRALIALSRAGIQEDAVTALIAAMPDGQAKVEARLWWKESNAFQRAHPTLAALAAALGLTSEQLDQLFITAAAL